MLPFTDRRGQHAGPQEIKSSSNPIKRRHPQQRRPRTPPSHLRRTSTSSSILQAPRILHREIRSKAIKEACKQDVSALFGSLEGTDTSADYTSEASSPQPPSQFTFAAPTNASHQHERKTTATALVARAPKQSTSSSQPYMMADQVWLDSKTTVNNVQNTINATFRKPATTPRLDLSNDIPTVEQAFADGKAAIRKASSRLTYHWHQGQQPHQRDRMMEAQVELGQSLRQAYGDAMERKERSYDCMLEGQVEVGEEEMNERLDVGEPWWSGEEYGFAEAVDEKYVQRADSPMCE